jgi:hypothetical protein
MAACTNAAETSSFTNTYYVPLKDERENKSSEARAYVLDQKMNW